MEGTAQASQAVWVFVALVTIVFASMSAYLFLRLKREHGSLGWIGQYPFSVLSTNYFALLFAILIGWICVSLDDNPHQQVLNVMLAILGGLIGWALGMFFAPYSEAEEQRFSSIGKTISLFVTGYVISKLDRYLEAVMFTEVAAGAPESPIVPTWIRLALFFCSVLVAMLTVLSNRLYFRPERKADGRAMSADAARPRSNHGTPAGPGQGAAMSHVKPALPVVVTYREIKRTLESKAATEAVQQAATHDLGMSDVERATYAAAIGQVLRKLERAEKDAGALVLTSPHDGPATRVQSFFASGEMGTLKLDPLPSGGLEAKFDTSDWFGWARVLWEKIKHPTKYQQAVPASSVPQAFPEMGRVALLGDWGTGLYGAPVIADTIRNDPTPYAMLMHLGDVYYSGTIDEVQERFLNAWPLRPEAIDRALNSNHEMYAGGEGYFKHTLARFKQPGSYFAHQNAHWTLVGLDLAYEDHDIDDRQVEWLAEVIAQAGTRRIVLFSHHQLLSPFETQGTRLLAHPGFRAILDSRRIFAWYYGHMHHCIWHDGPHPDFGLHARCVGHGGMPESRAKTRNLPKDATATGADWRRFGAKVRDGVHVPGGIVLEGRNVYITGEEDKFLPNGYAVLTFDGPKLVEQVMSPTGEVLFAHTFAGA